METPAAVRSRVGRWVGGVVICGVAALGAHARGDVMYHVTNLGSLAPVGLDNQGRAYLNQSSDREYHVPNPPYRDRTAHGELTTARRYESTGPNAGTFTDLGTGLPTGPDQAGPGPNPASTRVVAVDANGQALVTTTQGTYLVGNAGTTRVDMPSDPTLAGVGPIGTGGGVTVLNHGYSTLVPNGYRQDVVTVQNGVTSNLAFPDGQQGIAFAVGGGGQVVGQTFAYTPGLYTQNTAHAFIARNGQVTDLGTLGGAWSRPTAVNAAGQVVGASATSATVEVPGRVDDFVPATHAFITENDRMKDLGTLPGDLHSIALGLNDRGQAVGISGTIAAAANPSNASTLGGLGFVDRTGHAFLHDGQTMLDLNALVAPLPGMSIDTALAINDLGQVLALGTYGTSVRGALLLTPIDQPEPVQPPVLIPEPGTFAVLGVLLGATALYRRRR